MAEIKRYVRIAAVCTAITVTIFFIDKLTGCSTKIKEKIVRDPAAPLATCEGAALGSTREVACEEGTGNIVFVCTDKGEKEAARSCVVDVPPPPPDECTAASTSFAAVQPILARGCNGCHSGYDGFQKATASAAEYLRRFNLPVADPQHMPKGSILTGAETTTFESWVQDGLCAAPDVPPDGAEFQTLDESEQAMLSDVTNTAKVDQQERLDTRYLVAVDVINSGGTAAELALYAQAAAKTLNSLSPERILAKPVEIAPGIYRFNLDDLGIDQTEWQRIERADLVNIESKTSRGQLLKLLTGTRKPWVHVETLVDTALRNSGVYYDLLETPGTFAALTLALGVDFAGDLRKRDVLLSAFVGSPLSPHNRMASVHESRDGTLWCTYDTGPLNTPEKNFFQFPLLPDVGGQRNGEFIAGECIYTLPNGLHGYALFNAKQSFARPPGSQVLKKRSDLDLLQNVAPVAVVRDFLSPVSSEITAGISCFRCHAGGILPLRDQIRAHVITNGAQFGADKDLVLDLYKTQPVMDLAVEKENDHYAAALATFGIVPPGAEPVSVALDAHLLPWDVAKVCGTLWLEKSNCTVLLNQSAVAQAQWGQLSSGGSITFEQFTQSLQAVIQDLRLFEDPL